MDNKKRILVVEDDVEIAGLLHELIAHRDYEVYEAHDGQEGLEKTKDLGPDLIILDLIMPKMDGITLCREIRKDPGISRIPIIVLTAKEMGNDQREALSAGANDFMIKPLDSELFLFKIKRLIGEYQIKKLNGSS